MAKTKKCADKEFTFLMGQLCVLPWEEIMTKIPRPFLPETTVQILHK